MGSQRLPQNKYTVVNDVLSYVQTRDGKSAKIPLINVSGFDKSLEVRRRVAAALDQCYSTGEGFAMLEGTGIPQKIINNIFSTYREFYRKSEAEKEAFHLEHKDDVGYKVISRNSDGSVIQEYFNYGLCVPHSVASGESADPYYLSEIGNCFFNFTGKPMASEMDSRWPPNNPETAALRESITAYYDEMEKLSLLVWEAFALALKLPKGYFLEKQNKHISHLQVNNYPEQKVKPPEGVLRIKAHFDVNAFSILLNDEDGSEPGEMGRLQVLNRDNEWKNMPLQPGAFILNIGELLHRWTNGSWKHVIHRVTNPINAGKPRITLGYFAFPDYDVPIVPLDMNGQSKYTATTCGEHSRTGRRYAAKFYRAEIMDELRKAQGLYEETEQEVDARYVMEQSKL